MSATALSSAKHALKKYEIVNILIANYGYRRFLEISTPTTGLTFHNIEPAPLDILHRYIYNCADYHDDGQAVAFRSASETSSDMLRALTRPASPDRPYDCIFIDPHHTYRSTAIDLAGAFALLADGGALVVHDCNPSKAALATATFQKGAWCGLTYAAFIDFTLRSAVTAYTVNADFGCGVVFRRPPAARDRPAQLERDRLALEWEVCRHDEDARYRLFERHREALLNLISAESFLAREAPAPYVPGEIFSADRVRPPQAPEPQSGAISSPTSTAGTGWWQNPIVVRHVNRTICGTAVDGPGSGDIERLRSLSAGKPFDRALSIGGGNVQNDIRLLQAGLVTELDLFDTCERRAAGARQRAENAGVGRRLHIHVGDPLAGPPKPAYQLITWNGTLQYRANVAVAIEWSRAALESGGIFFMNGYVGPNRRHYTDRQLALAERARAALPANILTDPASHDTDTDACPQSEVILPAIRACFPQAVITPTGGIIYLIALNDALANLDEARDEEMLRVMLLADDLCIGLGESLHAVAHARRL